MQDFETGRQIIQGIELQKFVSFRAKESFQRFYGKQISLLPTHYHK